MFLPTPQMRAQQTAWVSGSSPRVSGSLIRQRSKSCQLQTLITWEVSKEPHIPSTLYYPCFHRRQSPSAMKWKTMSRKRNKWLHLHITKHLTFFVLKANHWEFPSLHVCLLAFPSCLPPATLPPSILRHIASRDNRWHRGMASRAPLPTGPL